MKRKPYNYSDKRKARDLAQTNWSKIMQVVKLERELKDIKLVAKKMKLSPQRIYKILAKARQELLDYNG